MARIALDNVRKRYGSVDAIKGVSLDIADGELVVLVGPSGCGKSTLLRMIAGLESITGGQISIGERTVNDLEPSERDIAMVFQNYALYPHMSVRQNLAYGLKNRGMPQPEIDARIAKAASALEIEQFLDRKPRQLSGGQRQRVAMGRAIVRNPSVFLFDEPLSNLDAKLRSQVRGEIRDLHQRWRTTSVYVTHDQVEAMTMGEKIVVLRDGRVEQAGTPLALYDYPDSVFVATFIGSPAINMFEAKIDEASGTLILADGTTRIPLPAGYAGQDGKTVLLGIRPEYLEVASTPGTGFLSATVHAVETTGSDTVVICNSAVGQILVSSKSRSTHSNGEQISLSLASEKILLFDKATERRIVPTTQAT
mgnify:CR=1 FL=1